MLFILYIATVPQYCGEPVSSASLFQVQTQIDFTVCRNRLRRRRPCAWRGSVGSIEHRVRCARSDSVTRKHDTLFVPQARRGASSRAVRRPAAAGRGGRDPPAHPGSPLAPRAPVASRLAAASQPQHRAQSQEQQVHVIHCTRGHVYRNPLTSRCRNSWVCRNSLTLPCFLQIVQISILGMCIICISK